LDFLLPLVYLTKQSNIPNLANRSTYSFFFFFEFISDCQKPGQPGPPSSQPPVNKDLPEKTSERATLADHYLAILLLVFFDVKQNTSSPSRDMHLPRPSFGNMPCNKNAMPKHQMCHQMRLYHNPSAAANVTRVAVF
jgi:hypothetical protein